MKLITPSFEIIEQKDLFKHIELCGRVCYKSEDNITETSSQKFIDNLIKSGHTSVLEHGTVYLSLYSTFWPVGIAKFKANKYSSVVKDLDDDTLYHITTNYRVLVENKITHLLEYSISTPTHLHEKRYSVRFVCDRGISHEFVRHRTFSFSQESTRYCNYSKDKFGTDCTFILPCWLNDSEIIEEFGGLSLEYHKDIDKFQSSEWNDAANFLQSIAWSESNYFTLLGNGWTPQQARAVLPNSLKTELIMTGFIKDWKHFFKLRCDESAHPQARELAQPLYEEFKKREYL